MTGFDESATLFSQAGILLMIGMAFVFVFLSLLIVVIKVIITPLGGRFPDPSLSTNSSSKIDSNKVDPSIIAAISVAINQYRQPRK